MSKHQSQSYSDATSRRDPPIFERNLQAHRSLSNRGFVIIIAFTATALCIPLLYTLGRPALWVLLPFLLATVAALWGFIRRNDRDRSLSETLRVWPDLIALHRHNARAPDQYWHANPYWVRLNIQNTKTIENYITLSGNGRTVELGSFLTAQERQTLFADLQNALRLSA